MKLDPRQSHYVLQALLAQRKVGARHVQAILKDWRKEIAALRERLATLEELGLSPKVRALRRQQGRYMGLVRRLNAGQKARVSAMREKKGLPAAIRLALSLGR